MRKELERSINEEAASYNHFACGSSVLRTRQTFYHAIGAYKKLLWHNYSEEPVRGQRIIMIHYTAVGGGVYVGNGQVEECGERKPMIKGCKWCYMCDVYEEKEVL